jgi:acyl-CoA synthetase (AMP-forming)/AMP-acid ligase II
MLIDGTTTLTYGQVIALVDALSLWLVKEGIRPGDRVAIQLRKCINEILIIYAAARLGCVVVNIHPLWSDAQLSHVIESSGACIAFLEPQRTGALQRFASLRIVSFGESESALDALKEMLGGERLGNVQPANDNPDALAAIIYTSGSTGWPKGVMHSQRNLVEFGANVSGYLGNREDDRILSLLPLSFGYGLSQLLTTVHVGATLVLQKSQLAADIVETLQFQSISGFGAVPFLWSQIVQALGPKAGSFPALRYVTNAGDALDRTLVDEIIRCLPSVGLVLMYGTTETLRTSYLPPERLLAKKGAIGWPVPGVEILVLTEDGRVAGPGERGELLHRGAHTMLGYWNDHEATAKKLRKYPALSGDDMPYCCTEDMVSVDADGCLWFEGRAKWMIKRNGFRTSLAEIEGAVNELGLVKACVASLLPNGDGKELVHLAVISDPDQFSSPKELLKLLRRKLPGYMLPEQLIFWPDRVFPHTPNGKLDRVKIKEFLVL